MVERRTHGRWHGEAIPITFETGGASIEGTVPDIGRGGLFIASTELLAVGKRIVFDVRAPAGNISGAGRVIWVRQSADGDKPAGMGVRFIDVDDAALAIIDALVAEMPPAPPVAAPPVAAPPVVMPSQRERTVLGIGAPVAPPRPGPARERTVLGIGTPIAAPTATASPEPAITTASRERTVLGIGVPVVPRAATSQPDVPDEGWDTPAEEASAATSATTAEPTEPTPAAVVPSPEPVAEVKPVDEVKPEPVAEVKPVDEAEPKPEPKPQPAKEVGKEAPREVSTAVDADAPKKSSTLLWIALVLVVVGVVAYLQRERLAQLLSPTPNTTAVPLSPPSSTPPPTSASTSVPTVATSAAPLVVVDEATPDAGAKDAGADAARDAAHDAIDSGKSGTTTTASTVGKPRPPPKPTATAADPY